MAYTEKCGKCSGKGFIRAFSGIAGGVCFDCEGKGIRVYARKPVRGQWYFVEQDFNDGEGFIRTWNLKAVSQSAAEKKVAAKVNTREFRVIFDEERNK